MLWHLSVRTGQNSKHISEEIDRMRDADFLAKMKLVVNSKLTNAAMVLLDHPEFDLETVFLIDKVQKRIVLDRVKPSTP